MSTTVPSTCLGNIQESTCMRWQGPSYPELGISTGDSLESVIQAIIGNLNQISESSSDSVNMSCLSNSVVSDCAVQIAYRKVNVTKSSATGGVTVMWDGDGISNGLPSGYNITAAQILLRGNDGSNAFTGSVYTAQTSIPLRLFPLTLDYTLFVYTPCGTIRLVGSVSISANPGTQTATLDLLDVPNSANTVLDLKEAVELLAREVCEIKNQL